MQDQSQFQTEFKKGRDGAMIMGGLVYAGVVVAATTLFISFILLAFPSNAYFTRLVMSVAGLFVGGSMLAFPYALHTWAVSGRHRSVTVFLYYGEMLIIAVNTIVSFASLLYKFSGLVLPDWIAWYEPFSIGSIVYTLFAWGTIFLLDPHIKAKAREHAALVKFETKVTEKMDEFLDSIEGEDAIMRVAQSKIDEKFRPDLNKRRHFGSAGDGDGQDDQPAALPPILDGLPKLTADDRRMRDFCLECGTEISVGLFCSDECEIKHTDRIIQVNQNRLSALKQPSRNNGRNP